MTIKETKTKEAKKELRQYIKASSKITIVITACSVSGMTRRMKVYKNYRDISWLVADLIGWSINDKGIMVSGCGMDMAFHLADTITWAMGWHKSKQLKGNGGNCIAWAVL